MPDQTPCLYIFSGLPGAGKTSLARPLARHVRAAYLRIDTVEQGLRDLCSVAVEGEGYRLCYRIVRDNLINGISVVADSCNPIHLTRQEWNQVARDAGAVFVNIEVVCSDPAVHRTRVESRTSDIPTLRLPSWDKVLHRHYEPWGEERRIVIDTAHKTEDSSFAELVEELHRFGAPR